MQMSLREPKLVRREHLQKTLARLIFQKNLLLNGLSNLIWRGFLYIVRLKTKENFLL